MRQRQCILFLQHVIYMRDLRKDKHSTNEMIGEFFQFKERILKKGIEDKSSLQFLHIVLCATQVGRRFFSQRHKKFVGAGSGQNSRILNFNQFGFPPTREF